ncbi:hypothetical protein CK203_083119 [Vitis vinifera]|uniref:Retrotransposon gag domain-containing protein n=1 Tax=Vitis vinifera TaxID=29760 RepID=A0A438DWP3_VITVI|nr:hypothetical protein CK203_083119 [Vitis vinifera]
MRSSMNVGKGIWKPSMLVLIMALIHGSCEDMDMKAKVATIARRLEELELKKMHEVQAISETKPMSCHAPFANHVIMWPNNSASYGNTYNSSWRNHPNFSWKPRPPPYQPQGQTQAPQQTSSVEQAIVNLSKVMGDFVGTCAQSRGLQVTKNAFLTEQVSAIIQSKSQLSIKIRDVPPFQSTLEGHMWEKALLDLGASVNLLPYSVYKQLGLGGLKPTTMTLSLADRSVKIPRG